MHLSISDWIGSAGVTILLFAYLLNLLNKISKESLAYINMNIIGAGLACTASGADRLFTFCNIGSCVDVGFHSCSY
jgi:hypothetical protein